MNTYIESSMFIPFIAGIYLLGIYVLLRVFLT